MDSAPAFLSFFEILLHKPLTLRYTLLEQHQGSVIDCQLIVQIGEEHLLVVWLEGGWVHILQVKGRFIVLNEVHTRPGDSKIQHNLLDFHVNDLSKLVLSLEIVEGAPKPLLFFLIDDLLHFIDASQNDLGYIIASLSCHLQDLFVKVYLFLSVGYLVH